jgi:hypothetical protein
MGENSDIRELLPHGNYVFDSKLVMHLTSTWPSDHLVVQVVLKFFTGIRCGENDVFARFFRDIPRQVFVRNEYHGIRLQRLYDGRRIA